MTDDPDALAALAERVAPTLVGLTRDEAVSRVADADPALTVRFAPEDAILTMEYRFGRITATLASGRVVRAAAG